MSLKVQAIVAVEVAEAVVVEAAVGVEAVGGFPSRRTLLLRRYSTAQA